MTRPARGRLSFSKLAAVAAVTSLALAAAGCGGDDETSSSAVAISTSTATAEATTTPEVSNDVDVSLTEYAMAPSNVLPDDGDGGPPTSKARTGEITFHIT